MARKKIKICFLSFYDEDDAGKYTIASMRLAGYLQNEDYLDISIKTVKNNLTEREIIEVAEQIRNEEIDIIGMSAYVWTWNNIKKISHSIRRDKEICVLVGGPEVQNRDTFDWVGDEIFSYGEGEAFVKEVCELIYKGMTIDEIKQNETIANAKKMGNIFSIDMRGDILQNGPVYTKEGLKRLHINDFSNENGYYETSRGCPYKCGYCGHKFRACVSVFEEEILKKEIAFFGEIGMKRLFVVDPILGGLPENGKKILRLFQRYAPNVKITSFLRPEYLDEEYLEILSKSNIEELRFGIQTINSNVPQWVRANSIKKILDVLPKLTMTGIPWRAELIVGLPGDDINGLKESIKFVLKEVRPTYLHAYHLSVLKETEMYRLLDAKEKQWIKVDQGTLRATESYSYSKEELEYMVNYAVLITSLYNQYAIIDDEIGKASNIAESYEKLNEIVESHMGNIEKGVILHYGDGVRYWKKLEMGN